MVGKPIIKGTRLAVEFIIDLLANGWTEAEILRNYPVLTRKDIQSCLAYAGWLLHLKSRTGVCKKARSIQQFEMGQGNYSEERHRWLDKFTVDEIANQIQQTRIK